MSDVTQKLDEIIERLNLLTDYLRRDRESRPNLPYELQGFYLPADLDRATGSPRPEMSPGGEAILDVPPMPAEVPALLLEDWVFPITLAVTSGTSAETGDATTSHGCGYEYDVEDAVTGDKLAGTGTDPAVAAVDPTASPHKWVRPEFGYMIAATFGYAHRSSTGALVVGWINEVADQEACA